MIDMIAVMITLEEILAINITQKILSTKSAVITRKKNMAQQNIHPVVTKEEGIGRADMKSLNSEPTARRSVVICF